MAMIDQYPKTMRPFIVGQVPNSRPKDVVTGIVADVAGIGFGKAVFRHASGDKAITQTQNSKFVGITVKDVTLVHSATADIDLYKKGENAGVVVEGPIVVLNGAANVAADDPVYLTSGGAFTNVSSGNTALPAKFGCSAAAAAPVIVVLT
jgi:hypothetical protein